MISYCLNGVQDKECLILTDVETHDVSKSVAVKVVKDEITVTFPCVLSKEDLSAILENVSFLFLEQENSFEYVSDDEVIRMSVNKYKQYFEFEIRLKYLSVKDTNLFFYVEKSSLVSFCNGILCTDVVFPDNIDNEVLFRFDYDPDSVTKAWLDVTFTIQSSLYQLNCDRKGIFMEYDLWQFYKHLHSFLENKTDEKVFINNYSDLFEFRYVDDRVFFIGFSNVYDDEESTIDYEGYMELSNIVRLHDQMGKILRDCGFHKMIN